MGRRGDRLSLDILFARKVKERDGWACRLCGSRHIVQCAHLMSRRYSGTRWDLRNAWTLCRACHYRYTRRPEEWTLLLEKTLGRQDYEELRVRALTIWRPDYAAIRLWLESSP